MARVYCVPRWIISSSRSRIISCLMLGRIVAKLIASTATKKMSVSKTYPRSRPWGTAEFGTMRGRCMLVLGQRNVLAVVVKHILDFRVTGVDVDDFIAPVHDIAFSRNKDILVLRKENSLRFSSLVREAEELQVDGRRRWRWWRTLKNLRHWRFENLRNWRRIRHVDENIPP